jgi:sRNA-binding regulator protein Hfq
MKQRTLLISILVLVFGVTGVFAETIYLKDGKIVRGRIVQEDDATVMVEAGDSWQKIDKSAIELIKQDDVQPAPAAAPAGKTAAPSESIPPTSRRRGSGWFLGLQVPYNMIDGDFDGGNMPKVDSGFGIGLIFGYSFDQRFAIEIDWAGSRHDSEGARIGFGEFSINLKYNMLHGSEQSRLYLFAGVGSFALGDSSLTLGGMGYNLGLGVDIPVAEKNTIGIAIIRKIITYDEIVKSDVPLTLVGDINGDTTSLRFDFTHHF